MKALTVCQPYAEMIAAGEKHVENRTWPTAYRGPLAIHAGRSRAWLERDDVLERPEMTFGAFVALTDLVECVPVAVLRSRPNWHEEAHHLSGPWCWVLAHVDRLSPVPYRGALGLWTVPDDVVRQAVVAPRCRAGGRER